MKIAVVVRYIEHGEIDPSTKRPQSVHCLRRHIHRGAAAALIVPSCLAVDAML